MSAIKCPFCEYRNFHAAETCINCGSSLFPQPPVGRDPSAKNKPSPGNRPLSNQPPAPENRPLSNQPPAPGNRPLSNQPPAPENRSIPNQPTVPRSRPPSSEPSAPRSRPPSNQPSAPRNRPIPNQPSAPRNRPIPNQPPAPRKNSSPNQKSKRLTPPKAPDPETRPEVTQGEQYLEHEPYANNDSYSETRAEIYPEVTNDEQYLEHGPYDPYSETRAEIYPEVTNGEQFLEHGPYSNNDLYSETMAEVYPEVAHDEQYLEPGPHSENESSSRDIVPYQRGANYGLVPTNPYTALEPYKVSNAVEQYQPQGILPALPTFVKEDKRPPHDKDKLPWGLPRRDPDVAGAIILIQQSQELPEYPNLIVGLTNLLTELIWLIPNDTMRKEEERLQVTTIRIRCEDDEKKDIRLIGYLRGANLTLGDDIWFWGWHRKGSLIARKGYNWTSKAVVTTHTLGLIVPALTLLILLGIGFLLFLAWPSIGSVIDSFVHLVPNKP